ncbi:MAG: hypothetical protein EAZ28_06365 [Oscillatoriales cyanobacterium]|nr:MAG: hypothetical protein EAZ28_06365 [Oscillatoriales cyanobacterium]
MSSNGDSCDMTSRPTRILTTDIELTGESLDAYLLEDGTFRCGLSKLGKLLGYHPKVFLPKVMTRNDYTTALDDLNYSFDFLNVTRTTCDFVSKKIEVTELVVTVTLPDASLLISLESSRGNKIAAEIIPRLALSNQQFDQERIKGIAEVHPKQPPPPSFFRQKTIAFTKPPSWVYFIFDEDNQAIKIGRSTNPLHRLSELQVGNSKSLGLLKIIDGGAELEHKLHKKFKYLRLKGEWFKATQELLQFIDSREGIGNRPLSSKGE